MRYLRTSLLALVLTFSLATVQAQNGIYDLEIVIFEQPQDGDDEVFPESPELPRLSLARTSLTGAGNDAANAGIRFLPLAEGELAASAYTLNRKGASVLAHLRWRQNIPRSRNNPWVGIRKSRLNGMVRLDRGRYIHLHTDLILRQGDRSYRIQERARARSGETHYVDHPKLGILFRADRYKNPNAVPATPATVEPPSTPAKDDNPPEQRAPTGELPRAMPDPT